MCGQGIGAGGVHIDFEFEKYIRDRLKHLADNPRYEMMIAEATRNFQSGAKRDFEFPSVDYWVPLGGLVWDDQGRGIKEGRLQIAG